MDFPQNFIQVEQKRLRKKCGYQRDFPSEVKWAMKNDRRQEIVKLISENRMVKAGDLAEDGDTILMDVGTTVLEFARFLKGYKRITVFTNAMQIAMAPVSDFNIRVSQPVCLRNGAPRISGQSFPFLQ